MTMLVRRIRMAVSGAESIYRMDPHHHPLSIHDSPSPSAQAHPYATCALQNASANDGDALNNATLTADIHPRARRNVNHCIIGGCHHGSASP